MTMLAIAVFAEWAKIIFWKMWPTILTVLVVLTAYGLYDEHFSFLPSQVIKSVWSPDLSVASVAKRGLGLIMKWAQV